MEARVLRLVLLFISVGISTGAGFQSRNFTVTAPDAATAERVAKAAENYRRDLAIYWLGQPLPDWSRPCRLRVKVGAMGAGGETKFQFIGREVVNWDMVVQGSLERILDSVLPHEVNHTIFACHFRKPLPRWADEGAATLFEHRSEQAKQLFLLNQVINSGRGFIELEQLLQMKEYPREYRAMLTLYAEGYALVDFLVQQGGRDRYLKFLKDGERVGWTKAISSNYAHHGIDALQKSWKNWILAGMPKLRDPKEELLAARETITRNAMQPGQRPTAISNLRRDSTVRLQSPGRQMAASNTRAQQNRTQPARPQQNRTAATNVVAMTDSRRGTTAPGRSATPPATPLPTRHRPASSHAPRLLAGASAAAPAAASSRTASPRSASPRSARPSADDFRAASFEAPLPPRSSGDQPGPQPVRPQTGDRTRPSAAGDTLDANFLPSRPPQQSPQQASEKRVSKTSGVLGPGRHLPQERSGKDGSIPQWAGFPTRSEAF